MILELDDRRKGDWDRFQVRNIGLAVQRLMAEKFDGDVNPMRSGQWNSLLTISALTHEGRERRLRTSLSSWPWFRSSEGGAKKRRRC